LLLAKENAQWSVLRPILKNKGKSWTELYKYVQRRKCSREEIAMIKDGNGRLITDSIEKENSLNYYYPSVFSSERSISQIQCANSCEPFAIVRGRLAAISTNKSVELISGFWFLKLGWETTIPYLA
jgi:hypothetical protein